VPIVKRRERGELRIGNFILLISLTCSSEVLSLISRMTFEGKIERDETNDFGETKGRYGKVTIGKLLRGGIRM